MKKLHIITLILCFITYSLFSQTLEQVFPTNRYWQVIVKNDSGIYVKETNHISQLNAEAKLNCRDGYVLPPTGKVMGPTTKYCPKYLPATKIDTLNIEAHLYGGVFSPTSIVLDDCKQKYLITKLPEQTIPEGTFKAQLKRTTNYEIAQTTYEVLTMTEIPLSAFRVIRNEVSQITSTTARIDIDITKKQSKIIGYLNGEKYIEFNPGSSAVIPTGWTYYFGYKDLKPNTMYEVFVENISVDGETTSSSSILFKTLP